MLLVDATAPFFKVQGSTVGFSAGYSVAAGKQPHQQTSRPRQPNERPVPPCCLPGWDGPDQIWCGYNESQVRAMH